MPRPANTRIPPARAPLPPFRKYKGALVWLAVTACICIAFLIMFQGSFTQVGITLAVVTVIASLLLKLAIPHLKARTDDKRIATIKTRQVTPHNPTPLAGSGRVDAPISHPIDASQLKATDSFALMHMGPPDVIDLDLTKQRDHRGKVAMDGTALEEHMNRAVASAIELDDSGATDKAIVQYEKALALARRLGRDDEALSYENRIAQLKQEKARG